MFPRWGITMSGTQESGAYLGGIGAMLEAADVCPACGQVHSDRQYTFLHRGSGQCPNVVRSHYAVVSRPSAPIEAHLIPDFPKPHASDVPISMGSLPLPSRELPEDRRIRTLSMPWLTPPDLGGGF